MANDIALALKNAVIDTVETQLASFLDDHQDAKDFLLDRAQRAGELAEEYVLATDDASRRRVLEQLEVVKQSVANEVSHLAVDAAAATRALFANILVAALHVLKEALPVIVAAL